jgi:hypothetical protein
LANSPSCPSAPWRLKSGRKRGKALECLMFSEPGFVYFLAEKSKNEALRAHAQWLVERGEDRTAPDCSFCQSAEASIILVHADQSGVGLEPGAYCRACAISMHGNPLPIKFSSAVGWPVRADEKAIARKIRVVYGLPERITAEVAFDFFSAESKSKEE